MNSSDSFLNISPDPYKHIVDQTHWAVGKGGVRGVFVPGVDGRFRNLYRNPSDISITNSASTDNPTPDFDPAFGLGRRSGSSPANQEDFDSNDFYTIEGTTSFGFAIWFRCWAWTSNKGIAGNWDGANANSRRWILWTDTTTNNLMFRRRESDNVNRDCVVNSSNIYNGQLIGVVCRWSSSLRMDLRIRRYDDGVNQVAGQSNATGFDTGTAVKLSFGGYRFDSVSTAIPQCVIYHSILAHDFWDDGDDLKLLDNPSGIFEPREQAFFPDIAAAGETITVDKWHPGIQQPYPHVNQVIPYQKS